MIIYDKYNIYIFIINKECFHLVIANSSYRSSSLKFFTWGRRNIYLTLSAILPSTSLSTTRIADFLQISSGAQTKYLHNYWMVSYNVKDISTWLNFYDFLPSRYPLRTYFINFHISFKVRSGSSILIFGAQD